MNAVNLLLLLASLSIFAVAAAQRRPDVLLDVADEADQYSLYEQAQDQRRPMQGDVDDADEDADAVRPSTTGDTKTLRCQRDPADGGVVCDCGGRQEAATLSAFRGFVEHFRIRNCGQLRIPAGTFAQVSAGALRSIHLTDIEQLHLESGSLEFRAPRRPFRGQHDDGGSFIDEESAHSAPPPGVRVHFRRVRVPQLPSHALRGHLEQVHFDECRLEAVHAFAISPTQEMLALSVQSSYVLQLDRNALKKFTVGELTLANTTFREAVPSAAIYGVTVRERLRIVGSRFADVLPNAFQFDAVHSFDLADNRIHTLNGSSFHMRIGHRCSVTGNNITELSPTSFLAIGSQYQRRPQAALHFQPPDFLFANNRIANREPLELRLRFAADAFTLRVQQLELTEAVTCHALRSHAANDFQRAHDAAIRMRTCPDCEAASMQQLRDQQCRESRTLAWVAGGVGLMVLLLFATVAAVWWLYRRRRAALARMQVVQPEARTYRETQIVIQIENAGLLKTDL